MQHFCAFESSYSIEKISTGIDDARKARSGHRILKATFFATEKRFPRIWRTLFRVLIRENQTVAVVRTPDLLFRPAMLFTMAIYG
jgi:hypothetical protein